MLSICGATSRAMCSARVAVTAESAGDLSSNKDASDEESMEGNEAARPELRDSEKDGGKVKEEEESDECSLARSSGNKT